MERRGWSSALRAKLCFTVLAAPSSEAYKSTVRILLEEDMRAAGLRIAYRDPEALEGCDGVLAVLATGGTEWEALRLSEVGVPLIIAAQPAANSASSLAEVSSDLRRRGVPTLLLGPLGASHPRTLESLRSAAAALRAVASTRGARLGVIGEPAPWLPHEASGLARAVGVEVIKISGDELLERLPREPPDPPPWLSRGALHVVAEPGALRDALRVHRALEALASDLELDAIAPSCPSFMDEAGSNACLAGALLNLQGLTVGCEGDVAATLALHLAQSVAGRPGFLGNKAWARGGEVLVAHCAAPPVMGLAYSVERHFITSRSPTLAVWIPRGLRVTLTQALWDGSLLYVGEGMVSSGVPWRGRQCESQILVDLGAGGEEWVMKPPNHVAVVTGPWSRALGLAWSILNPGGRLERVGSPG